MTERAKDKVAALLLPAMIAGLLLDGWVLLRVMFRGHLLATPAGQREPRSFARGPPKTTNKAVLAPRRQCGAFSGKM